MAVDYTISDTGVHDSQAECCAFFISPSLPPAHEGDRRDLGKLWVPTYTRDIHFNGKLDDDARPRTLSHVFELAAEAAAFHFRMGSFADGDRIFLRHGGNTYQIGHVIKPDRIEVRNARTGQSARYERRI